MKEGLIAELLSKRLDLFYTQRCTVLKRLRLTLRIAHLPFTHRLVKKMRI